MLSEAQTKGTMNIVYDSGALAHVCQGAHRPAAAAGVAGLNA
jgi:hypothetical protein